MRRYPINDTGKLAIDMFLSRHAVEGVSKQHFYQLAEDEIYYAKTGYAATIYLAPAASIDQAVHKLGLSVDWFAGAMEIVTHLKGNHFEPTAT